MGREERVVKCHLCGAEGASWTQFAHGHARACARCRAEGQGWLRGEGKPVCGAMPKEDDHARHEGSGR